jgi:hypothetical protein
MDPNGREPGRFRESGPMLTRLAPYLVIVASALLFFADLVLHPSQVLYSDFSDLLTEHFPAKHFLIRSFQATGEIPLWCPYSYAGMPLIHDIQVAPLYPLHWPLYFLPADSAAAALSWLIAIHLIVAGCCMYRYAVCWGLTPLGALVAGLGYMFAAKWLLHLLGAGHYITVGLAWLPLVLLYLERAIRRRRLFYATAAGVAFALLTLGTHPQWTFYAGLFVALWTLAPGVEERALRRWLGYGLWAGLVAIALSAVQLLPTIEASRETSRTVGVTVNPSWIESQVIVLSLVGPSLVRDPPPMMWEDRGGFTLIWLVLAVMAPVLGNRRARYPAVILLLLVLFSVGAGELLQGLPGFRLFRNPSRMFLLTTLPVSLLAGISVDSLAGAAQLSPEARRRCRLILLGGAFMTLLLVGSLALRMRVDGIAVEFHPYWVSLLITVPLAFWMLENSPSFLQGRVGLAWLLILLADVLAMGWPLVEVRPLAQVFPPSRSVQYLAEHATEGGRVLDRSDADWSPNTPLAAGAPLALVHGIEPVRGFNPLDILRYKEYLQFVGDEDEPLRPMEHLLTVPVVPDFPLKNKSLLDLLGVRYLLQPSASPMALPGWEKVLEDPDPKAYDFVRGGVRQLPSFTLYENRTVLPRAFVVPEAVPLPDRPLATLARADFRRQVFLEEPAPTVEASKGQCRPAQVRESQPNQVAVTVPDGPAGYLVLTDLWFPGWTARVDGQPAHLYRADYAFRAVWLPGGAHDVVFRFAPVSYLWGKWISLGTIILLALGCLADWLLHSRKAA